MGKHSLYQEIIKKINRKTFSYDERETNEIAKVLTSSLYCILIFITVFPIIYETLILQFNITNLSTNIHSPIYSITGIIFFCSTCFLYNKGIVLSGRYFGILFWGLFGVSTTLSLLAYLLFNELVSLFCYPLGFIIGYMILHVIYNNAMKHFNANID